MYTRVYSRKLPQEGWKYRYSVDLADESQCMDLSDESYMKTCEICKKNKVRFMHMISHPLIREWKNACCECAIKLLPHYFNPKLREEELSKKHELILLLIQHSIWDKSDNGNLVYKLKRGHITILPKNNGTFTVAYNNEYHNGYENVQDAKWKAFSLIMNTY